jgi:hypothetical protein
MIDLDHLDALDDTAPPPSDLDDVRARAGRMRARRRWTAVGAGVAVLLVAVGIVAAVREDDNAFRVQAPTLTTPMVKPSARGVLPGDVSIDLTLETPEVVLGGDVRATVVVHNETSENKMLGIDPIQCALGARPVLYDPQGRAVVDDSDGILCRSMGVNLAPGASRAFDVRVSTADVPTAGRYFLTLQRKSVGGPTWALDNVPVTITASGLGARLEIPQASYPAGALVEGTIVFDNPGPPIEYELIGCEDPAPAPWAVWLAKDGATFEVGMIEPGCIDQKPTRDQIAVGESRSPFNVSLTYPACTSNGAARPDMPRCTGPLTDTPALEPGIYEIVLEGMVAPFDTLEVEPVRISVVSP